MGQREEIDTRPACIDSTRKAPRLLPYKGAICQLFKCQVLSAAPFNVSPLLFYVGPPRANGRGLCARPVLQRRETRARAHYDEESSPGGGERLGRLKLIRLYGRGDVMYGAR